MEETEDVVMTPTKKGKTTRIQLEKRKKQNKPAGDVAHVAGGQHAGLVVNKEATGDVDDSPPQLQLEFKCWLVDRNTGNHIPESRILKFWFSPDAGYLDRVTGAYEFFRELVQPNEFPRDYVGFIKKCMKQLQKPIYKLMRKCVVDLRPLDENEALPMSPGMAKEDTRPKEEIAREKVLQSLEAAYPSVLAVDDILQMSESDDPEMVTLVLEELRMKDLIQQMEGGRWMRKVLHDTKTKQEIQVVKQMPTFQRGEQPTVAIITAAYSEKLAVDSMIEEKTTFMRYKTGGESNVYTLGYIGQHKVVSTKLPQIGRTRAAQISSGNITTRLLGTFSNIEHVFLVGCGGGVPHYTDFYHHTRLGDVVVSTINEKGSMYIYCDKVTQDRQDQLQYTLKSWAPNNRIIQDFMTTLKERNEANPDYQPWNEFIADGMEALKYQQANFSRPLPSTDKLYMNVGDGDVIEVGHPPVPEEAANWFKPDQPNIRYGSVGSGKPVVAKDQLRLDFAYRHNIIAYDTEFDQVLESVCGNVIESFVFIRGISDYYDGARNKEWTPYAALAAAAYMKTLIQNLPNEQLKD